ncbi:hypothetical protein COHA_000966 [Chlorella ohadii]|uniref:P-type ATPase A domain-containing protein n=1 Tax=Chlorella ohadii TaxID=2649997 RepID=A0AAD5DXM3_9CHLO|nr:hypothetical protein COHA_000966 [Chlorella ohadii]
MKSTVAAAKLVGMVHLKATVVRSVIFHTAALLPVRGCAEERRIDQAYVVPGDCVRLTAGEMLPGDVRIMQARDLHIAQAALTGESMPAAKSARAERSSRHHAPTSLLDCRCLAFRGTHVVSGTGLGIVVATGSGCYIATMAEQLRRQKPANAFQLGVQRVSYLLIGFMAAMVPLVVISSGLMTRNWGQALLFGISVAVGLTPEMLPMVVNANLARGAISMAKQRVLVKRLDAVQNLGAMDILCCDKTGTLTMDEVMLARWLDYRGEESRQALLWAFLNARFQTGLRNLLDGAILETGRQQGVGSEVEKFSCVDELPFDFVRRRLSVVLQASQAGCRTCLFCHCTSCPATIELPLGELNKRGND